MKIDTDIVPEHLDSSLQSFWEISDQKIRLIEKEYDLSRGSPVFTINGKYTTRAWTDWTQGFQYGSRLLQFDATGDEKHLEKAKQLITDNMASHVSDFGVHDHGFNNISTYGNLWRLMREEKIPHDRQEQNFYEMALKVSGAVQARRWTRIREDGGFIYSFNGPHSLFVDTIRSLRSLAVSHLLGHTLHDETGGSVSLLERLLKHAYATARYSVYYGDGRDSYDVRGRTVHECIFNVESGRFRCPSTQQGYSPFTTWTRGLSWAMAGFAEQLEYLDILDQSEFADYGGWETVREWVVKAATATGDFFIENTPIDGIPYWDTGAPNLWQLGDYLEQPADPFNAHEPVDSSAAAIGVQGLLRLGHYFRKQKQTEAGGKYFQAGLTVLQTLLDEPYLSTDPGHQGLLLHSIYHRPNGWDHIPEGQHIPCGESCMWGDYHLREAALYVRRLIEHEPYYAFFGPGSE